MIRLLLIFIHLANGAEAPKEEENTSRMMRRNEELRPMQEITIFRVDADAETEEIPSSRSAASKIKVQSHLPTDKGAPAAPVANAQKAKRAPSSTKTVDARQTGRRPEEEHSGKAKKERKQRTEGNERIERKGSRESDERERQRERKQHEAHESRRKNKEKHKASLVAMQTDPHSTYSTHSTAALWGRPSTQQMRQMRHEEMQKQEEAHHFQPAEPSPPIMSEQHQGEQATTTPGAQGQNVVAARKRVLLNSTAVVQSKRFAEELIAQERETLCPNLPSQVNMEILAANTKIAEELIYVFRAKLTTESHSIPNQAVEIMRTGIEVEWVQNPAATTNDEQSAFARAEEASEEALSRGAKLVLPLAACDLMNVTFFLMCNRSKVIPARPSALIQQDSVDAVSAHELNGMREMRELYLSLPGGLGILVDKEREAYKQGIKHRTRDANLLQLERSYPSSFSWLYERPQCLDYVHHQGTCGACYMFAALDSLSDRHCIDTTNASQLGKVEHLSVQMALLCEPLGRQCSGGWADVGFNYSVYFGLQLSSVWPYERSCLSDSECQFGKQCFSPSSYACPDFFTQEELDEVATFSDALRVTKQKCETSHLVDPDNCKVWAEMMFAFSPTMVFMPESCFCDELVDDWAKFAVQPASTSHGHSSGMVLMQEHKADQHAGQEEEEGFNFFTWLYNLFAGGSEEKSVKVEEAESWDSEIPGGGWSSETKTTNTHSTTTVEQCSRDRCFTEPQPHKATKYHYVLNTKDEFKRELIKDGPLYTSYFIYEDFTWFFTYWPEQAYNYQWGSLQGGHAVVLIGWESSCTYHGEKIRIPGQNDAVRQRSSSESVLYHGECWHLRNTWGDEWGDKGYFRMVDDMLTGPEGYHLHIASAAADGPKTVQEKATV